MEGFIANDEEVEKELEEQRIRERQEMRGDKPLKKKKKKVHKPKQLDDEDIELVKENVGVEIAKKKMNKLKKIAE